MYVKDLIVRLSPYEMIKLLTDYKDITGPHYMIKKFEKYVGCIVVHSINSYELVFEEQSKLTMFLLTKPQ